MKILPSTKIALSMVALGVLVWGGWRKGSEAYLANQHFSDLKPGRVNLIAVQPGQGYRIIVANRVAQLVEGGSTSFASETDKQISGNGSESGEKYRISIRDMIKALAGDDQALSRFVMWVNRITEDKLPTVRRIWKAEQIQSALVTDGPERNRLESELNVHLNGSPLDTLNISSVESGIVLDLPVRVRVAGPSGIETRVARVLQPFRPRLMEKVSAKIQEAGADITAEHAAGIYRETVNNAVAAGGGHDDIAKELQRITSPGASQSLAEKPERLLTTTKVIVNEFQLESAGFDEQDAPNNRKLYDIHLDLTPEGRNRMWKFSRDRTGFQLLFTVDGYAIAAPVIKSEMFGSSIRMSQLPDGQLVKDAVDTIRELTSGGKKI